MSLSPFVLVVPVLWRVAWPGVLGGALPVAGAGGGCRWRVPVAGGASLTGRQAAPVGGCGYAPPALNRGAYRLERLYWWLNQRRQV